jgi:hypothetical protein
MASLRSEIPVVAGSDEPPAVRRGASMKIATVGLDISKQVFEVDAADSVL